MTEIRDAIAYALWGHEPFPEKVDRETDFQGWNSDHPYLINAVRSMRPRLVIELGVWKGCSTITIADEMRKQGIDGVVIAVDTWLGWHEEWPLLDLHIIDGYPTLYRTFQANVIAKGLTEYVVPLPIDSVNATQVLLSKGINQACIVHIDGAHDYASVKRDIEMWWPLVAEGGVMIGDDYSHSPDAPWPNVARAFDEFFGRDSVLNYDWKCVVRK